jgi:hypothetical protein
MLKRWITGLLAGATLVGGSMVGLMPGAAAAGAAGATTCPTGHYPADVVGGRPTLAHVGATGMALWADHFGWHLRVSEAGKDRAVFTGQIVTDGVIKDIARRTEGGDLVLDAGTHRVLYRFTNYGAVDGIDFVVPCSSYVRFAVSMNHTALPTSHIVLGAGNAHPASNPFTITKIS